MTTSAGEMKEKVRRAYKRVALKRTRVTKSACCAPRGHEPDYGLEEIASVPPGAYLAAGSGNPVRAARLRRGETVVDLGSGAGMDAFLAANQVGASGRVIGFDMTPEMVARAQALAARGGYPQVEFRSGDIERLPLAAESADVVLSNCVINLAPDKAAVYREIYRVLRPGGRFAIADIVLEGKPTLAHRTLAQLAPCACIGGALERGAYLEIIRKAGFEGVEVVAERPMLGQPLEQLFHTQAVTIVGRKPS
jgi:SAM-dependent methyltransferase